MKKLITIIGIGILFSSCIKNINNNININNDTTIVVIDTSKQVKPNDTSIIDTMIWYDSNSHLKELVGKWYFMDTTYVYLGNKPIPSYHKYHYVELLVTSIDSTYKKLNTNVAYEIWLGKDGEKYWINSGGNPSGGIHVIDNHIRYDYKFDKKLVDLYPIAMKVYYSNDTIKNATGYMNGDIINLFKEK